MGSVVSSENPALQSYAYYSSILVIKMLSMSFLTGYRRFTRNTFTNPEDHKCFINSKDKTEPKFSDPVVERVRRAHLNDLENIPAFLFVSGLYLLTNPSASHMNNVMMSFTAARFIFTLVYAFREVQQPARFIACLAGYGITLYVAGGVLYHFK